MFCLVCFNFVNSTHLLLCLMFEGSIFSSSKLVMIIKLCMSQKEAAHTLNSIPPICKVAFKLEDTFY